MGQWTDVRVMHPDGDGVVVSIAMGSDGVSCIKNLVTEYGWPQSSDIGLSFRMPFQ